MQRRNKHKKYLKIKALYSMHDKEKKISTAVPLAPLLLARKKGPVLATPWDFTALVRNVWRRDCSLA